MKWMECSVHTTPQAIEPVSSILNDSGASGVVIEDTADLTKKWEGAEDEIFALSPSNYPAEGAVLKAYFPLNDKLEETIEEIKLKINGLTDYGIDAGSSKIELSEVDEEDWANEWKKYYKPVKVTETITIVPTWENYTPDANEHIIELDPGMAFGTGTHATTVLCLQALEKEVKKNNTVVDVGTGSGVLSIAAAKLGASSVTALDVDDMAVSIAQENAQVNKVDSIVSARQNNLLKTIDEQYDVVVANILAEIIIRMVEDARKVIKPGGTFITSGIIAAKKDEVKNKLESSGFEIKETIELEDWVAFIAKTS
ncbi:50S ribosomal protein L11 methyltransferase [Bacillus sp. FJAT-44742]|uniref:50S ribosomal protein L11 methyltransferase n=1 Tax=Bacillus sp. FJAT-44742 TaxID=2014005 RepID=UPI000C24EDD7|nr:50S ribosomal protein L11 methyltransferase [Bacillus sp. FJAT-44742]